MCAWCRYTWGRFERTHGFLPVCHTTHHTTHTTTQEKRHSSQQHTTAATTHNNTPQQQQQTTTHGDRAIERQRQKERTQRKREEGTKRGQARQDKRREKREEDERQETRRREENIKSVVCVWLCGFDFSCFFVFKITRPSKIFEFSKLPLPTLKAIEFSSNFLFVKIAN